MSSFDWLKPDSKVRIEWFTPRMELIMCACGVAMTAWLTMLALHTFLMLFK